MKKRLVAVLLMMALVVLLSGCSGPAGDGLAKNEAVKYTLYIGLNDKDTYAQKISDIEAEKKVSAIALKYVDDFTQYRGKGAYKDEKGEITQENTLIFTFYSATDQQMKGIMDEVLKELNQNTVLIEKQKVGHEFYGGQKQ
jgi:hypothetical protein